MLLHEAWRRRISLLPLANTAPRRATLETDRLGQSRSNGHVTVVCRGCVGRVSVLREGRLLILTTPAMAKARVGGEGEYRMNGGTVEGESDGLT